MMRTVILLMFIMGLSGCTQGPVQNELPYDLKINEIQPDRKTALMKQNILHLAQVYDLSPFLFTKSLNIAPDKTPPSHPVLTLSTRFADRPHQALSHWLHQELHWWVHQNAEKMRAAVKDLRRVWPRVPVEGKSKRAISTYTHLVICWLEHEAMNFYVGKTTAKSVLRDFIRKDKLYPWANSQVLNKGHVIRKVVLKHGLLLPPLM